MSVGCREPDKHGKGGYGSKNHRCIKRQIVSSLLIEIKYYFVCSVRMRFFFILCFSIAFLFTLRLVTIIKMTNANINRKPTIVMNGGSPTISVSFSGAGNEFSIDKALVCWSSRTWRILSTEYLSTNTPGAVSIFEVGRMFSGGKSMSGAALCALPF